MRRIYLDNNATTPVLREAVDSMHPFWAERFGNASAVHSHGRSARSAVDDAREHLAHLLNVRAADLTFTSGGTESDNHALFGTLAPGQHLITTAIEHHAVLHAAQSLEKQGVDVTYLTPNSNGLISPDQVREAFRPNTTLVSVMLANNETGVLQPVQAIGRLAHSRGALLHTDAVQAIGKLPVDLRELGADMVSISAHKMHAPQGVGALYVRKGVPLKPFHLGGPHERQRRAGTENVPGIVALGEAARQTTLWIEAGGPTTLATLHAHFETELLRGLPTTVIHGMSAGAPCPASGTWVSNTPGTPPISLDGVRPTPRLPNTTSARFPGVDSEAFVIALDLKGLAISGGSACTSGAVEPSHVLLAQGLSDAEARETVRISLSRLTTPEEIDLALDLLESTVTHLRTLHPGTV